MAYSVRSEDKKRIGFFGGSFDPIHLGHINLAVELYERHHLDEVWFCPANQNPHKTDLPPTSSTHRQEMIELAIQSIPNFRLIDTEIKKEGPSYTVDTLTTLKKQYESQNYDFFLLLGEDALCRFSQWKKPECIVEMAALIVASRSATTQAIPTENPLIANALAMGLTKTPILDISSTYIRQRLKQHLYCGHLLPAKVLDYIYAHHLYLI